MSRANFYCGQSIKENIREDVNFYSGQSIKEKMQVNKDALTSCLNVQGLRPHLTGMGVVDQGMMDSIVQVNIMCFCLYCLYFQLMWIKNTCVFKHWGFKPCLWCFNDV